MQYKGTQRYLGHFGLIALLTSSGCGVEVDDEAEAPVEVEENVASSSSALFNGRVGKVRFSGVRYVKQDPNGMWTGFDQPGTDRFLRNVVDNLRRNTTCGDVDPTPVVDDFPYNQKCKRPDICIQFTNFFATDTQEKREGGATYVYNEGADDARREFYANVHVNEAKAAATDAFGKFDWSKYGQILHNVVLHEAGHQMRIGHNNAASRFIMYPYMGSEQKVWDNSASNNEVAKISEWFCPKPTSTGPGPQLPPPFPSQAPPVGGAPSSTHFYQPFEYSPLVGNGALTTHYNVEWSRFWSVPTLPAPEPVVPQTLVNSYLQSDATGQPGEVSELITRLFDANRDDGGVTVSMQVRFPDDMPTWLRNNHFAFALIDHANDFKYALGYWPTGLYDPWSGTDLSLSKNHSRGAVGLQNALTSTDTPRRWIGLALSIHRTRAAGGDGLVRGFYNFGDGAGWRNYLSVLDEEHGAFRKLYVAYAANNTRPIIDDIRIVRGEL